MMILICGVIKMSLLIEEVKIDSIIIGERTRQDFGDIDGLAASISEIGLLQPILVSMVGEETFLVDGHRRILAYEKLGLIYIPAKVFDPFNTPDSLNKTLLDMRAQYDANMVRKDFTPSEAVHLSEFIKSWVEAKRKLDENNKSEAGGNLPPEKKPPSGKKTRDVIAKKVGMSYKTLEKAKAIVESAKDNPENADLVKKMDETGKVDTAYKKLQEREHPEGSKVIISGVPGKMVSLIVKMPDGRQKKMGSVSTEWFQNRNVLSWIVENVGLGTDEKDIIIHREGNVVYVFDSTDIEQLGQGIKYLVNRYSFEGSLINVLEKEG
jgi:ParB-like chromosome segregation protein Spo0J